MAIQFHQKREFFLAGKVFNCIMVIEDKKKEAEFLLSLFSIYAILIIY